MRALKTRFAFVLLAVFALFTTLITVAPGQAQAAQGMKLDCSIRSTSAAFVLANGTYRNVGCGGTYSTTSANGITRVVVNDLPFCVYFGTTLAGCSSPGVSRSVENRSGQIGRIVPQNPNS